MNTQIYEEASAWLVDLRTGEADPSRRRRFERWLGVSPEHVHAYLELIAVWEQAGARAAADKTVDVDALMAAAQAETNVVRVSASADTPAPSMIVPAARRRWRRFAAAAAVLFILALAVWLGVARDPVYATEVAELRSLMLSDGSNVELAPRSRIRVRYSGRERRIDLLSGQALFRVAKAANRPFIVDSGQTSVRAVGTEFDVYRKRSGTVVTVLEGRVAVSGALARSTPRELAAGQRMTVTAGAMSRPVAVPVPDVKAWIHPLLVFEGAPLAEVADEFNRYHGRQIVLEGPGLEDFHVSGTFPVSDPLTLPKFVEFLRSQHGLQVSGSSSRVVVRAADRAVAREEK